MQIKEKKFLRKIECFISSEDSHEKLKIWSEIRGKVKEKLFEKNGQPCCNLSKKDFKKVHGKTFSELYKSSKDISLELGYLQWKFWENLKIIYFYIF